MLIIKVQLREDGVEGGGRGLKEEREMENKKKEMIS